MIPGHYPQTRVNGSTSDDKIASLPLMTRSLILGLQWETCPADAARCAGPAGRRAPLALKAPPIKPETSIIDPRVLALLQSLSTQNARGRNRYITLLGGQREGFSHCFLQGKLIKSVEKVRGYCRLVLVLPWHSHVCSTTIGRTEGCRPSCNELSVRANMSRHTSGWLSCWYASPSVFSS